MALQTSLVRVDRPFTGGLKDDPTRPGDAAELDDALFPLGIACERGGFTGTGETVASSGCVRPWEEIIGAGAAEGAEPTPDILVAGPTTVTIATNSSRDINLFLSDSWDCDGNDQGFRIMPGTFNGEVLILPLDGLSPIMTYAGQITVTSSIQDTAVVTTKGSTITGMASMFPEWVGAYIYMGSAHGCRRIVGYINDTTALVDVPWDHTLSASTGRIMPMGVLNLFAQVAKSGKATKNGTTTTVTGTGTRWDDFPQGEVGVHEPTATNREVTDYIAPIGVDYGTPLPVTDVVSATSLTVGGTTPPTWGASAVDYVVGRHMPGRVACVHKATLYTAGYRAFPGRLYHSPPRWDSRQAKNLEFSYDVEIGKAMMMAYTDVPDPFTVHEITGLLSLPSGNLGVLCSSGTYVAWGQHPSLSVEKTSDYGNISPESTLIAEGGAWMAGPEGVFEFGGQNSPRPISGDIDRRYRAFASSRANPTTSIALGYFDGHLIVSVVRAPADGKTFVWDIRRRVWCGEWSLGIVGGYYYSTAPQPTGHAFGVDARTAPARLLAGRYGTQVDDLSTAFVDHQTPMTVTDNPGAFRAKTPIDFTGDLSREREVKYLKVQHQMTGADGGADVIPGPDGTVSAMTLTQTTGAQVASRIAFPDSALGGSVNTLGQRTNRFDVEVTRNAGTITKFAVHELEVEVKQYRHRG